MPRKMVYKGSLDGSAQINKIHPVGASQTITAGELLVLSSGKAVLAADAATAGTVLGVAAKAITTGASPDATDIIPVDVNPNSIYEMPYKTGTKTSVTNEDIGTSFDLGDNAYSVDLDDTTGGFLLCQGFDNNKGTMDVLIQGRVQNV